MSAHTEGRAVAGRNVIYLDGAPNEIFGMGIVDTKMVVAITGHVGGEDDALAAADAVRLAACWNACQGIPSGRLELLNVPNIIKMVHESDMLRAELKNIRTEAGRLTDVLLDEKIQLVEARKIQAQLVDALTDAKQLLAVNGIDINDSADYGNGRADDIVHRCSVALDAAAALTNGTLENDDARRMAACWNACLNVDTQALEVLADEVGGVLVLAKERDDLAANLATAAARNDEMIDHAGVKAMDLAEARAGAAMLQSEHLETIDECVQLRAQLDKAVLVMFGMESLLQDILKADDACEIADVDVGGAPYVLDPFKVLIERIRTMLANPPDLQPRSGAAMEYIGNRARQVVDDAAQLAVVLTVRQVPRRPLAMGNYETVVEVRPARERAQ